jgi:hypothetical protein
MEIMFHFCRKSGVLELAIQIEFRQIDRMLKVAEKSVGWIPFFRFISLIDGGHRMIFSVDDDFVRK